MLCGHARAGAALVAEGAGDYENSEQAPYMSVDFDKWVLRNPWKCDKPQSRPTLHATDPTRLLLPTAGTAMHPRCLHFWTCQASGQLLQPSALHKAATGSSRHEMLLFLSSCLLAPHHTPPLYSNPRSYPYTPPTPPRSPFPRFPSVSLPSPPVLGAPLWTTVSRSRSHLKQAWTPH